MNNINGMFDGWKINHHNAVSPDGRISFWIPNGYSFFKDEGQVCLLNGLDYWERRKIWKELKVEIRKRSLHNLNVVLGKDKKYL